MSFQPAEIMFVWTNIDNLNLHEKCQLELSLNVT